MLVFLFREIAVVIPNKEGAFFDWFAALSGKSHSTRSENAAIECGIR